MHNNNNNKIIQIDLSKLDNDLWDAREINTTEQKDKVNRRVEQLAKSIQRDGLDTPILIALPKPNNAHYSIVCGRLRVRAHKKLGLKTIDCIFTPETDKKKLAKKTFTENNERAELTLDEQLIGIIHLFEMEGYSPKQIMYWSKRKHNGYSTDPQFDILLEQIPAIGHERKPPSPNYLYQIMQTIVQLHPRVKKHMKTYQLPMSKRIMLTHTKLRQHVSIQLSLIERIAGLTPTKAKLIVNQKIRDLETGAVIKSGNGYVYDETLSEKIDTRIYTEKSSIDTYLEILEKIEEIMYLLTGHKRQRGEFKYTSNHVDYSELHRINILKTLTKQEVTNLEADLLPLTQACSSFLDMIDKQVSVN